MLLCGMPTLEDSGLVPCRQECWSTSPLSSWQGVQKRFSRLRREVLPDLAAVSAALSFLMFSFASRHCSMDIRERECPTEFCGGMLFVSRKGASCYWKYEPKGGDYFFTFGNKNISKAIFPPPIIEPYLKWLSGCGRQKVHTCCADPCCLGGCHAVLILFSTADVQEPAEVLLLLRVCWHHHFVSMLLGFWYSIPECIARCFGFKQRGAHSFCIFMDVCIQHLKKMSMWVSVKAVM